MCYKTLFGFLFFLMVLPDGRAQIKLLVLDTDDEVPVAFSHVISKDKTFSGYTNAEGEIMLSNSQVVYEISCLGYENIEMSIRENSLLHIVYLKKSAFTIEELTIKAKSLDIYKEVHKVWKVLKNNESRQAITTLTAFETIVENTSIEKGAIYCLDMLQVNKGFQETSRLFSDYSFDPDHMFLSVDIDRFIKKVNLTNKVGYKHLFNRGKIKNENTELALIEEIDSSYVVSYSFENQKGLICFNKFTYMLEAFRFKGIDVEKSIYTAINKENDVEVDTLILSYEFNHGFIKNTSFSIATRVQGIGKVTTSGYIKGTIYSNKKYSTFDDLVNVQFDAFLSDFSKCKPQIGEAQIFFDKEINRKRLVKDNDLTLERLQDFGYAPHFKLWQRNQRITEKSFQIFDSNIDFGRSFKLRSDYHSFQIDWVLIQDQCDEEKAFGLIPSIWKIEKAVFISKTKYHALLLANLTFDIYEVFKREMILELKRNKQSEMVGRIMRNYHLTASKMVNEMNSKSNYGNSIEGILAYNEFVVDKLGIDNITLLADYIDDKTGTGVYSKGDVLLAVGRTKEAIEFYEDILKDLPFDKVKSRPLYQNIIQAYHVLQNEEKKCKYFKEWVQLSNENSLELSSISVDCN